MHTNLKTVSGCATRITVTISLPEDTTADTTLTAYCRCCGDSHPATVDGDTVTFPPLPAGEHLYELRAGGIPVIHGHLISRQSPYPMPSGSTIDHALAASLDGTTVANISVTLTAGPRGPKGDPGLTDTEHALLTAAANGALWVPGSTGSVTLAGQQGDGVAISAANNTSRVQVQDSGVTITAKRAPQWLEAGDTPAFHDIRTAKDLTATDESLATALAAKQDTLTPGDGINISGNVISATPFFRSSMMTHATATWDISPAMPYIALYYQVADASGNIVLNSAFGGADTPEELAAELNKEPGMSSLLVFSSEGNKLIATAAAAGEAGNGMKFSFMSTQPPDPECLMTLSGGGTIRPAIDNVENGNAAPITSAAVYNALGNRSSLKFDTAPTANSNNLMTSGSIYTALAAKQDTLTPGDGIDISAGTVAMSGSLQKSLAIGGSRVEEAVICDGPCAVYDFFSYPITIPQWQLSENGWSGPYGPSGTNVNNAYNASRGYSIGSFEDLQDYAAAINNDAECAEWMRAVAFKGSHGEARLCLVPTANHAGAMILNDTTWTPFWQQMEWYDGIEYFRNQRVTGMVEAPTDYTLSLNGTAIQPATDKVEAGNNAPVSSAAVYAKLDEVNTTLRTMDTTLNGKQNRLTLQTTLSNSTTQATTGAAVYKALGNKTALAYATGAPAQDGSKIVTEAMLWECINQLWDAVQLKDGKTAPASDSYGIPSRIR